MNMWHLKKYFLKLSLIWFVFSQDIFPPSNGHIFFILKIKTQFTYSEIHSFVYTSLSFDEYTQLCNKHKYQDTAQPHQALKRPVPRGAALAAPSLGSDL